MDEKIYRTLADQTLRRILDAFDQVDAEDADVDYAGDVINIRYRDGSRCVVNTQGPARQLWLAGQGRGWHFSYDDTSSKWLDDKGSGDDILGVLARITHDATGATLQFG